MAYASAFASVENSGDIFAFLIIISSSEEHHDVVYTELFLLNKQILASNLIHETSLLVNFSPAL